MDGENHSKRHHTMETSLRFQRLGQFHCQGKELIDKVKQLIEQDKEKEKAAKEAERTRKRQNKK